ncbi:NifU family protein [Bacteroidetes bacterium endosymbiont of Geopemphigus sp.]|uniref:NifU family protein n=1 Tax=Bacteroidetes bacterium endosymbiont of Geopemphigus sp. TaxID=2047937 RepID=UPI000CD10838|nr:NifU family protein [Bacteroidetes bacterium endosymbiont of Geopemphigus sp.]
MNIHVENTPLPNIIKFVSDEMLTQGSYEFEDITSARDSPLSTQLLEYHFVKKIFITANFIALERIENSHWESDLIEELRGIIERYLSSGHTAILSENSKKEPVSVYIELTPNPQVIKFITNYPLVSEMLEIRNKKDSYLSPLAEELFSFSFVRQLFFMENYISVTKDKDTPWDDISLQLRDYIAKYLQQDKPVVHDLMLKARLNQKHNESRSAIEEEILSILKEYVEPMVARDGGHIQLISFDPAHKTANMLLQGACSDCPSSMVTLKDGIENLLKNMLPGKVEHVQAHNA